MHHSLALEPPPTISNPLIVCYSPGPVLVEISQVQLQGSMPARKKSRTGVHLAKLNQVHPRVRHDDEGAALLATLALIMVMPLARTDVRVCCTGSDPEYNDALPLDDESPRNLRSPRRSMRSKCEFE